MAEVIDFEKSERGKELAKANDERKKTIDKSVLESGKKVYFSKHVPKDGFSDASYEDITKYLKEYFADTKEAAEFRRFIQIKLGHRKRNFSQIADKYRTGNVLSKDELKGLEAELAHEHTKQKYGKKVANEISLDKKIEFLKKALEERGGSQAYHRFRQGLMETKEYMNDQYFKNFLENLHYVEEIDHQSNALTELIQKKDHHKYIREDVQKHIDKAKLPLEVKTSADIGTLVEQFLPQIYQDNKVSHDLVNTHKVQFEEKKVKYKKAA